MVLITNAIILISFFAIIIFYKLYRSLYFKIPWNIQTVKQEECYHIKHLNFTQTKYLNKKDIIRKGDVIDSDIIEDGNYICVQYNGSCTDFYNLIIEKGKIIAFSKVTLQSVNRNCGYFVMSGLKKSGEIDCMHLINKVLLNIGAYTYDSDVCKMVTFTVKNDNSKMKKFLKRTKAKKVATYNNEISGSKNLGIYLLPFKTE